MGPRDTYGHTARCCRETWRCCRYWSAEVERFFQANGRGHARWCVFFHYLLAGPEEADPVQFFQSLSPGLDKPWMVSVSQNFQPGFLCVFTGSLVYCKDRLKGRPCRDVSKPALAVEHLGETSKMFGSLVLTWLKSQIQHGVYLQSRCQSAPPMCDWEDLKFRYIQMVNFHFSDSFEWHHVRKNTPKSISTNKLPTVWWFRDPAPPGQNPHELMG